MKRVKIDNEICTILWIVVNNPPQGESYKGLERIEQGLSIKKKIRNAGMSDVLELNDDGLEIMKSPKIINDWKPKRQFLDFETAEHMVLKNWVDKTEWRGRLKEVKKTIDALKDAEEIKEKKPEDNKP